MIGAQEGFCGLLVTQKGWSRVTKQRLKQWLFRNGGKILAEYLIRRRRDDEPKATVIYKLDRVAFGENIETRPATHAEKVRLHKFVNEEKWITLKSSHMRDLHAQLALAIYSQDGRCPNGFNQKEWKKNLLRAKDLVGKRRLTANDLGEITNAIIPRRRAKNWRKQLCGWCHTPLLIGYSLDGHKITRAKEFCSDACKMNKARALVRRRRCQELAEAPN